MNDAERKALVEAQTAVEKAESLLTVALNNIGLAERKHEIRIGELEAAERARSKIIRDAGYAWCEAMMAEGGDVWLRALPNGDIEQLTIYDDHFQFETIASPPGGES